MIMQRPQRLLLILTLLSLSLLMLAACGKKDNESLESAAATATFEAEKSSEVEPLPTEAGDAPYTLFVKSPVAPALDAACLVAADKLTLVSPSPLTEGLEPGLDYLFCAAGASPGQIVTFALEGPLGVKRIYEVVSGDDGVAALSLRLTADDEPGAYKLRASAGEQEAEVEFRVLAPTGPFIALTQPLGPNPTIISASIGGLPPESRARFALYRLDGDGDSLEGVYLISTLLMTDPSGRADVELDVADLPTGAYLLTLLPPGMTLGDPPTFDLAQLGRLAVLANILRVEGPAEDIAASATPATEPQPSPQEVELPAIIQVRAPEADLPVCQLAAEPMVEIGPAGGEMGNWWYGCARGFGSEEALQVSVQMPNGQETRFSLKTNAAGAAPFRWYSAPHEGAGRYQLTVANAKGQTASVSWNINPATRPHVLVFPHNVETAVGAEYYLAGFPPNAAVDLGLYRLDENGQGQLIDSWVATTDATGSFGADFGQIFDREAGQYALVAVGGPVFKFSGVDATISAIDFFSYNSTLDERYEVYTLNLNRGEAAPVAEAAPTPIVETDEPPAFPPPVVTLSEDLSPKPACPDAAPDKPAACLLPTTVPRGTFTYILMHGYAPKTNLKLRIITPKGETLLIPLKADAEGFAQAHWYALNDEPLGEYKVRVRGGGNPFDGVFNVVKPVAPSLVIQPRVSVPNTPVIASFAGFEPKEELVLARYRSTGSENGALTFTLVNTKKVRAGGQGGGQVMFKKGNAKGEFFLVNVYRPGQPEPLAQAVYQVGKPLYLRYPMGWAQNLVEGQ
ncbi:MAG: hypothetical protein GXP42_19300 [Chloroflexi bacterium]|nr:hypothetical protein [Chloroflexota bacterium]